MGSPAVKRIRGSAAPRVVVDTNVVLSALVFGGGATARVRQAWQTGRLLPLASTATVQELMRVLAYPKFKLSADGLRSILYIDQPSRQADAEPRSRARCAVTSVVTPVATCRMTGSPAPRTTRR